MTFRADNGVPHVTTMTAAFEDAGYQPDLVRLRAVILDSDGSHSALWLHLKNNKALAIAAMGVLDEWARSAKPIAAVPPTPRERREEVGKARAQRREEAKAAAVKLVRAVETRVIERALTTFRLSDGSLLAKRHWYELNHIARRAERDGKIIRKITALVRPSDDRMLVGDIVSPDQFDKILSEVRS